jgi:hypothetical protein
MALPKETTEADIIGTRSQMLASNQIMTKVIVGKGSFGVAAGKGASSFTHKKGWARWGADLRKIIIFSAGGGCAAWTLQAGWNGAIVGLRRSKARPGPIDIVLTSSAAQVAGRPNSRKDYGCL